VSLDENKSVVQAFYEQWSAGAIDFERLVHADVTNHQPGMEPETGLEPFRRAIEGVTRAVPDSSWTILRLIGEGDLVVCHNVWSGTYGGTMFRGVPTRQGRRFSAEHVHVYRVTDRRIAEHWVVRDDLGMMQQLGATPGSAPPSFADS
jgi:predicted ester cyclase